MKSNQDRTLGICLVNVLWPDIIDFAKRCRESSSIGGIKLHFDYENQSMQDPKFKAQLINLLDSLKDKLLFFLIHFDYHHKPLAEAKVLFDFASKYQKQNFIIAHAAEENFEVLVQIGNEFRANPGLRQNIYTEISTVFTVERFFSLNSEKVIKAWREFGMKNVLFGSDISNIKVFNCFREVEAVWP